jgi:microcystin-dependent protein
MADPFLSEMRMMSFGYPPRGWALCDGQLLPINQNQALFSLLGTTFGGDGRTNFMLPDLRARTPIHVGDGHGLGEAGGASQHTLAVSELPGHTHAASAATAQADQNSNSPAPSRMPAQSNFSYLYGPVANLQPMAANALSSVGDSRPHDNQQPYLALTCCIALVGIFPSAN